MAKQSQRQRARDNLLTATVNAAIERGLIPPDGVPPELVLFEFNIAGEPVLASVRDGRYGELGVQVMVRPNDRGRKFAGAIVTSEWRRFAEALALAWMVRRNGRFAPTTVTYHATSELTYLLSQMDA